MRKIVRAIHKYTVNYIEKDDKGKDVVYKSENFDREPKLEKLAPKEIKVRKAMDFRIEISEETSYRLLTGEMFMEHSIPCDENGNLMETVDENQTTLEIENGGNE